MKYVFPIYRMTYNKLMSGEKKIDIRLYDDTIEKVRPNDVFEYVCTELNEKVYGVVRGVMLFDTLASMEQIINPRLVGYSDWNEIRLRIERLYPLSVRRLKFMTAIFIETIDSNYHNRRYGENDRDYDDEQLVNYMANKPSSYETMPYRDDRHHENDEELEKNSEELIKIAEIEHPEDEEVPGETKSDDERESQPKISLSEMEYFNRGGRE